MRDLLGLGTLPKLSKPKDIYNYMVRLQVRTFGTSIDLSYAILMRNLKLLIKKYGAEQVIRGIWDAHNVTEYPFSTALVEQMIVQRLEMFANCPLNFYQESSHDNHH